VKLKQENIKIKNRLKVAKGKLNLTKIRRKLNAI
jgi:hypothetical protein